MRALLFAVLVGVVLPWTAPAQQVKVPPGAPLTINVQAAQPAAPPVSINLGSRHAFVSPSRVGFTHTGGGNIDVQQPSPDTVVITMTGVAVAGGHPAKNSVAALEFDLSQALDISFDKPEVKRAKLTVEGRVIGLLRSHAKGSAQECGGATIAGDAGGPAVQLAMPGHSVAAGDNMSINDRDGPVSVAVVPGKYTLHQTFSVTASHPCSVLPCKAASAEFAPDPALDPLWISYWEPFHGAAKKDFGFQITIRVADDTPSAKDEKK
jgi:hypothetical protein